MGIQAHKATISAVPRANPLGIAFLPSRQIGARKDLHPRRSRQASRFIFFEGAGKVRMRMVAQADAQCNGIFQGHRRALARSRENGMGGVAQQSDAGGAPGTERLTKIDRAEEGLLHRIHHLANLVAGVLERRPQFRDIARQGPRFAIHLARRHVEHAVQKLALAQGVEDDMPVYASP